MTIEFGFCHCGCDNKTTISSRSDAKAGSVKGQPRRFLKGHGRRLSGVEYLVEDCGYKTPCWVWQLSLTKFGHGQIKQDGVTTMAHRIYYEKIHGPIPPREAPLWLEIDHLCRLPRCVNPDHLEIVPRAVNQQRGSASKLSENDVLQIRRAEGSNKSIALQFGVSSTCVGKILRGISWKNVQL